MKMIIFMVSILLAGLLHAQETVLIWPDTPPFSKPNALKETVKESWGVPCVYNVTKPTLTVYAAKGENSGRSMIILPGGGYEVESFVAEGSQIAEHLSSNGILAAVLKYRLPHPESSDQPHLLPITDARQAISVLRSKAAEYGIDAEKVGIMGFSAGGHLATAVSVLRSKNANENPDYSALVYAVTTLGPDNQKWLEESLYHRAMTEEEKARYSLGDHVDDKTPPAFLVHAYDDEVVPIEESELYAKALFQAGVDVETHYFAHGDHGFGPGREGDGTSQWLGLLANWIKRQ